MRNALLGLLLVATAMPAVAAESDASAARRGAMLRDANNVRLGTVDSVRSDGSVGIIFDSRIVVVPASSLSTVEGKLVTKLTKAEVKSMR